MEEQIINLSEEPLIVDLNNALAGQADIIDIERTFINYCKSNLINEILTKQLAKISRDEHYSTPNIWGKLGLRILNNEKFIYSIQLYTSGNLIQTVTAWTGSSRILVIKGLGNIKIRILQVPTDADINHFKSGIELTLVEEKVLKSGDIIANWDSYKIIEIVEVYGAVIIESLEIKNPLSVFYWTFNNMNSTSVTSSKSFLSRLMTVIDLAIQMETDIPQKLYDTIFILGDPRIKFRAIEAMLLEGHEAAEDHFRNALESGDPILSSLAQGLYNKIFANQ